MPRRRYTGRAEISARRDGPGSVARKDILAKAMVKSGAAVDEASALTRLNNAEQSWRENSGVVAPYDPDVMLELVNIGPHIRPNIDAYEVNIDGHGHGFSPVAGWMKNLDSEAAREEVRSAMEYEAYVDSLEDVDSGDDADDIELPPEISDEEIDAKIAYLSSRIKKERYRADSWFRVCVSDMSFIRLRRAVRRDVESIGWGCIEFIPDESGQLQRLGYVPAHTVRPVSDEGIVVAVAEPNPVTVLSENREIIVHRHMPRFVQVAGEQRVFFKSPSDPRFVSRLTGVAYEDIEAARKAGEDDPKEAHELLWIAHHDPTTLCSPPRWIGNLLRILGGREGDETNYHHLRNKLMSGGMLFVNGGKLARNAKERIETAIANELQGSENTSRVLVVEATPMNQKLNERTVLPQIEFKSLRDSDIRDGMFIEYDRQGADSIGASFRQSPILRGRTPADLNRATAETAVHFGEMQVYEPERTDFDWLINKYVMPRLGVQYLRFVSNAPPARSINEVGEFVKSVAPHGGLVPNEIRELSSQALAMELAPVDEDWGNWPMVMTLAGLSPNGGDVEMSRLRELEEKIAGIMSEELRDAGIELKIREAIVNEDVDGG